ncbi:hypothetical protein AK812_SmicGene14970 [Symbiodinium microadriaticum]|uniref:Uncharacterized protein n=1 Tax=Symbiodinium microadriaticum TaxID=2951 RepID=A0A1Q9E492_SYMMI|nr:hypothetical protein AK812_SmicGene14970 [Symbiodinium microadriaticum]CAE7946946.1 unnamed protein product [Symbiodinium sp. KB8]
MRAPPVLMLIVIMLMWYPRAQRVQDRDFVELFCGKMEAGLRGTSLDIELDPHTMDFLKPAGAVIRLDGQYFDRMETNSLDWRLLDGYVRWAISQATHALEQRNYTRSFGEFLAGAFLRIRSEPFFPQNRLPGLGSDALRKSDYELFVQAQAMDVLKYISKSKSLELPGNWANVLSLIGLGG